MPYSTGRNRPLGVALIPQIDSDGPYVHDADSEREQAAPVYLTTRDASTAILDGRTAETTVGAGGGRPGVKRNCQHQPHLYGADAICRLERGTRGFRLAGESW